MKREFADACLDCYARTVCEQVVLKINMDEEVAQRLGATVVEGSVICTGPLGEVCNAEVSPSLLGNGTELNSAKKLIETSEKAKEDIDMLIADLKSKDLRKTPPTRHDGRTML